MLLAHTHRHTLSQVLGIFVQTFWAQFAHPLATHLQHHNTFRFSSSCSMIISLIILYCHFYLSNICYCSHYCLRITACIDWFCQQLLIAKWRTQCRFMFVCLIKHCVILFLNVITTHIWCQWCVQCNESYKYNFFSNDLIHFKTELRCWSII